MRHALAKTASAAPVAAGATRISTKGLVVKCSASSQRSSARSQEHRDRPALPRAAAARGAPRAHARRGLACRSQPVSTVQAVEAAALPQLPPLDDAYEASCAFSSYANWLLPGALLVGRYPYVEPSRCSSYDQGEAQLESIVAAGPHVFVSLQAEVPPQAELKIGGVGGFMPYKAVVELIAASQTPPPPMEVVNGLRNPQLDQFLPRRKKAAPADVLSYYERERVTFLQFPIVDLGVPDMQQLSSMVSELQARLARGDKVYMHCWGGRGRVGTVGACLLAQMYGLSADEALERVQRAFDTRRDNQRLSPETDEQRALVRAFVAQLAN